MSILTIHKVKESLGEDIANALCDTFPGRQLYISKKQTSMQFRNIADRDNYICGLFLGAGKSYDEIAALMGLSKDRIMKIISKMYKNKK